MHRFDDQARMVLGFAREEALRLGHPRIAPEHLLLGVLRQNSSVAQSLSLSLGEARTRLEQIVGRREATSQTTEIEITEAARLSMETAAAEARRLQANQVSPGHLLLGVIRQAELSGRQITGGIAVTQILGELEGGIRGVMRRVLEGLRSVETSSAPEPIAMVLKLEPEFHQKLQVYADNKGQSLEATVLEILQATIAL